jgi:hypothetical protein
VLRERRDLYPGLCLDHVFLPKHEGVFALLLAK